MNRFDAPGRLTREDLGELSLWGSHDLDTVRTLIDACSEEARRAPFPLDSEIYALHGRVESRPIIAAGNLSSPLCIFGRELGKDEVRHAQPQVGAAGKLVRRGLLAAAGLECVDEDPLLEETLQYALLSNTVPFKPPGNKAYSPAVKERFRPYVARLLGECWKGSRIITLGTEAFFWFGPYFSPGQAEEFWRQDDRYERELDGILKWQVGDREHQRGVSVAPLPHPSPLNRQWVGAFPELLAKRLDQQ